MNESDLEKDVEGKNCEISAKGGLEAKGSDLGEWFEVQSSKFVMIAMMLTILTFLYAVVCLLCTQHPKTWSIGHSYRVDIC